MAVEDAATLGELFRRMNSKSQVAALLSAFEDIRQPRTAEIQASERGKTDFVSLPRGSAARTARDEGFKAAMAAAVEELEDAEEEVVATNLGDYVAQWAHDAHDAVEDWWTKYGGILDGQDGANGKLGASSAEGTMRDRALSVTEVKMKVERFVSTAVAV
jgi:salicylate hydroxylase